MKLLRVHIIEAQTCGGLLDGLDLWLRSPTVEGDVFEPLCLIGPNGSGKSQFMQIVAEIFQSILSATVSDEERMEGNSGLQFEVEYLIGAEDDGGFSRVRAARKAQGRKKPSLAIERQAGDEWVPCELADPSTLALLPAKVVGYTSGDNETLSLPFLVSRGGYAEDVRQVAGALAESSDLDAIPDTRLTLVDYGTHLEVLVANLLLGTRELRAALLEEARLESLHSFRCIVQLNHPRAPKVRAGRRAGAVRKGVQLTAELESHLDHLRRCSTCHDHEEKTDTYTFDFFVDQQSAAAFAHFWESSIELYSALHKLAMLNDLMIPEKGTNTTSRETTSGNFASRLPEPQDEDKVFRFEYVNFYAKERNNIVNYVSLSDGEHQLAQLLGTAGMVSTPNALFLLDEPESHFNPQWRVKFISRILELPTAEGLRGDASSLVSRQDFLLTTHAPFVASDTPRDRVFVFKKNAETEKIEVRNPNIETFGTTFDAILEECFGVEPPISQVSRKRIAELMESEDTGEIEEGIKRLGHSVDKVFLADRLRELRKTERA